MLVLLDAREHDAGAAGLGAEVPHDRLERVLEDVVGEHDADLVAVDEPLGEREGVGDPARLLLVRVEETVDAELVAVAEQAEELARVGAAGDEHQLAQTGLDQRLDRVRDHRPVVDRQQVLVGDPRQRMETRAAAARQDHALHARESAARGRRRVRVRSAPR